MPDYYRVVTDTNRNITRGFISIFSGKVGSLLLGLFTTPALVRILNSSEYGDYVFILSLLSILLILSNAGINDGIRKFIAESRNRDDWTEHVFGFYLRFAAILGIIVATGIIGFSETRISRRIFESSFNKYFHLLAVLLIARQFFRTLHGALMGLGLEHISEPLTVIRKVLFGVIGILLAVTGQGVSGVLIGHIIASFSVGGIAVIFLARHIDFSAVLRYSPKDFPSRELMSFNLFSVILILLTSSLYHVDILLLKLLSGSIVTGHYRAGLLIAEFLWFAPVALQTVLLHSTSELWANDEENLITKLSARITRYTFAFTLLLALGMAALIDIFVPIYFGPEFNPASNVVLVLLPGVLGFAVARPIFAIGQGKGSLRVLILATGTAALLNLALNILLIPQFGMLGAGAATSVGYCSMLILHVFAARSIGFDPIADLRLLRVASAGLLTTPVIFGLKELLPSLFALVLVPPIGFLVYTGASIRFGVIDTTDLEEIQDWIPSPIDVHVRRAIDLIQNI